MHPLTQLRERHINGYPKYIIKIHDNVDTPALDNDKYDAPGNDQVIKFEDKMSAPNPPITME